MATKTAFPLSVHHHTSIRLSGVFVDFLCLSFLWVLGIMLVGFSGNFPLNDDWSYGIAVQRLVEEGVYDPTVWTSMSLITHVLWGALFSYVFGFDFEVLRLSTLVLSLLALFSVYVLVRQIRQPRLIAILVPLAIAFNPLYFQLSYTFMTDVPFIGLTSITLVFFLRYLKFKTNVDLFIGTVFACLAILCRQNGLFIPIAFGFTLLLKNRFRLKSLLPAILPGALGLGALLSYQSWLEQTGKMPELYGKQIQDLVEIVMSPGMWPASLSKSILIGLTYLGLFLLPVFIIMFASETQSEQNAWVKKWVKRTVTPLSLLLAVVVYFTGKIMPLGNNILHDAGVGPLTLKDVYFLKLSNIPVLPEAFWLAVTGLSIVGASILLVYMASIIYFVGQALFQQERTFNFYVVLYFLLGTLIYCAPILFLGFYDRYLLVPLILIALVLLTFSDTINITKPKLFKVNIALLTGFAFFSIAGTHDYLSWNEARWIGLQEIAEQEEISYAQVDGGFEYNGFTLFRDEANRNVKDDIWWTEEDDVYMFTFGEVPGYEVVKSYEYSRWLIPGTGKVLLLKKSQEAPISENGL